MDTLIMLPIGEKFPINERLAGIVPMASYADQSALTADIRKHGLKDPLMLWRGEIVDGRCRQLACTLAGVQIRAKELDSELTEDEVRIFVKSVNTRRHLTNTQKIISACKASLDSNNSATIKELAVAWSISEKILKNARYIAKVRPDFIEPLFNGESVKIVSSNGTPTSSVKVSAVYAYLKRLEEQVVMRDESGWEEDTAIKTQAGKDWYYNVCHTRGYTDISTRMLVAELANFKFVKAEDSTKLQK